MSANIDEPTLQRIEQALQKTGIYVAPDLTKDVTADDVAAFTAARTGAEAPIYAVVTAIDYDDPTFHGNDEALLATIHDDLGLQGTVLAVTPGYDEHWQMTGVEFPGGSSTFEVDRVAQEGHPTDPGAMLLDAVQLITSDTAHERYQELQQHEDRVLEAKYGGDGHSGVITAGVLGAVVVLAAVFALGVRAARRVAVAQTSARTTDRPFTLPPAVLSTVREAEDQRHAQRASADVLALGEAIDAAELRKRLSPAAAAAWQAALDHYDVARRILDRRHSPADVIGALVLAGRGRAALGSALRGKAWSPSPTCYFDPLHNGATQSVQWRDGERSVTVPACPACARAVAAGETPDALDFVAHGRPRHYFTLDLGVWSRTGYGALDPDLVGALLRDHR